MEMKHYLEQMETLNRKLAGSRQKLLRTHYHHYHITDIQYQVLAYIDEHPGTSIGTLAKSLHQDPGNMSALCKKLEQNSFLARQKKPEDERSVSLQLCEKGKACVQEISTMLNKRYEKQWKAYTRRDKEMIMKGLSKLNQFLDGLYDKEES